MPSDRRLDRCPTCGQGMSAGVREQMGLRTGHLLNQMCPGRNGPSDIDHVLNNDHSVPQRTLFYEYKHSRDAQVSGAQWRLHRCLEGLWTEVGGNERLMEIRFQVLHAHPDSEREARRLLLPGIKWLWPDA